jgi:ATP-dependent protease HslVU (ClpYQ) ATPase subunit
LNDGLSSVVGNSKSNVITINIKSLIEKSDIHVNYFDEAIDNIESVLIDALLRVANSGARINNG